MILTLHSDGKNTGGILNLGERKINQKKGKKLKEQEEDKEGEEVSKKEREEGAGKENFCPF